MRLATTLTAPRRCWVVECFTLLLCVLGGGGHHIREEGLQGSVGSLLCVCVCVCVCARAVLLTRVEGCSATGIFSPAPGRGCANTRYRVFPRSQNLCGMCVLVCVCVCVCVCVLALGVYSSPQQEPHPQGALGQQVQDNVLLSVSHCVRHCVMLAPDQRQPRGLLSVSVQAEVQMLEPSWASPFMPLPQSF